MAHDWNLDDEALVAEAKEMAAELAPGFHGVDPRITGAVLTELLGTLIAGHHPEFREELLALITNAARKISGRVVEQMIKEGHAPPDWREHTVQ